jgi:streptomycin 6-kinase
MNLPESFTANMRNAFEGAGEKFLSDLPSFIDEAAGRWGLTNIETVDNLSYHYVAFARQNTRAVVLKIGVPNDELTSQIETLRLYAGRGACALIEADQEKGMLLLERLMPGRMLSELKDDEQATRIGAQLMRELWQPAPHLQDGKFISLRKWFDGLDHLRRVRFGGGTGPLPEPIVERAQGLVRELFAMHQPDVLLHGDFHHYNVLQAERGWLVIDPKGVIGPAGYEVGPFLINPFDLLERPDPVQVSARRIAILAEGLGFERELVQAWGIAHAVLSAWWSVEEKDGWADHSLRCAEAISAAKI